MSSRAYDREGYQREIIRNLRADLRAAQEKVANLEAAMKDLKVTMKKREQSA